MRVTGIDCGKDSIYACTLEEVPADLKKFARSYKPQIFRSTAEDLSELVDLDSDFYVLEPTGSYSTFWINALRRAGRTVRLLSTRNLRSYRAYKGILTKTDKQDAAIIAAYSFENSENPNAFMSFEPSRLRTLYLQLNSTVRSSRAVANRLGQQLGYEMPELVSTFESAKRHWLEPDPPALWAWIAGREVKRIRKSREDLLINTCGVGLSDDSRSRAELLCCFEQNEYQLELAISEELSRPEIAPYCRILECYEVPPRIQAALISRIYPFENFLKDGRPVVEYVHGEQSTRKSGKTKRDRSEAQFKLCLGMGRILAQSGSVTEWKPGGCRHSRIALWQYVKMIIVVGRNTDRSGSFSATAEALRDKHRRSDCLPWLNTDIITELSEVTGCSPRVAALRLHYEFNGHKKGNQRVMATAGRFCRMLYKDLLTEFALKP